MTYEKLKRNVEKAFHNARIKMLADGKMDLETLAEHEETKIIVLDILNKKETE